MSESCMLATHKGIRKYLDPAHMLAFVSLLTAAVVAVRFYHAWVTGYMLPDEFFYYEKIVLDHQWFYGREVFSAAYMLFFGGAESISGLMLLGAAFALTWGLGTAFLAYKIAGTLEMPDDQRSLLLLSFVFFPVYTAMLPMILTETMALFFAMIGIYFTIRFHKRGMWFDALVSSLAFVAAYKVREPYLLFALANFIGIVASRKKSTPSLLAYLVPLALVFPLPVSLRPLQFGRPVCALLLGLRLGPSVTATIRPLVDLPSFLYALTMGLIFGYNPVFAVVGVASVFLAIGLAWRKRTALTSLPPWNALAGLTAYVAALLVLIYPASGLIPVWTSTAIRATHPSLPIAFTLNRAYGRIGAKAVTAMFLVLIVAGSVGLPFIAQAMQSNLTRTGDVVNRVSFEYRAPYYRLYELAKNSGRTLVFALNLRGAQTYLSTLPNTQICGVPASDIRFKALLAEGWDTIYLYDYYYTVADPSSLQLYPQYYKDILTSRWYEGYKIETLWIDAESYAFRMTPVAPI